jgi:hypothetical protein
VLLTSSPYIGLGSDWFFGTLNNFGMVQNHVVFVLFVDAGPNHVIEDIKLMSVENNLNKLFINNKRKNEKLIELMGQFGHQKWCTCDYVFAFSISFFQHSSFVM